MPEQAWEDPALAPSPYGSDPATASIGFSPGRPAGSASPLTWAQAQFARLVLDVGAGRALEQPAVVANRYGYGLPGQLPHPPQEFTYIGCKLDRAVGCSRSLHRRWTHLRCRPPSSITTHLSRSLLQVPAATSLIDLLRTCQRRRSAESAKPSRNQRRIYPKNTDSVCTRTPAILACFGKTTFP